MLQTYQCHKLVNAAKIQSIALVSTSDLEAGYTITFSGSIQTIHVTSEWVRKHQPDAGGYYVEYSDGYTSYSPAQAFEDGYMPVDDNLDAMHALNALRQGKKVSRHGWNGKNMWLELQVPDEHSKMTKPYIYLNIMKSPGERATTLNVDRVPWVASQTDILSNDWFVVD